ncbi:NAD(P)-dependent oxidoreductase [Alteribacter natronophilus]|uniref:NAD(P)-dependent oxidoreductase n=1 Tax=Alteribacter natronophilus TaxID=2583810 RepID=UPI00110DADC7|nr:NAD(P)H-binding protein [Alteribacter natronophilus]TMW70274.1 NAD-dependent epimerase/dehydratase family protein [Alteribacter natronophilus]
MNILLFGTTGRTGRHLLQLAGESAHHFTVFVRSPHRLPSPLPANVRVFQGDASDRVHIERAMSGIDGVISCLSTDKQNLLSTFTPHLVESMNKKGIKRAVTIGTAGILQSRTEPELFRFQSTESKRKSTTAARDHLAAYEALRDSDLHWTIVCPTYLPDGEASGRIRAQADVLPENPSRITTGDTAEFAFREFFREEYTGHRVGLTE